MVRVSVMHDALKTMHNAEKRGKRQVLIRPSSKVVVKFLQVMMKHGTVLAWHSLSCLLGCFPEKGERGGLALMSGSAGYISEFEFVDDHRAGKIVVQLNGRWVSS